MNDNLLAIPKLEFLTQEQKELVHRHSIEILKHTGLKVESPRAMEIFQQSGMAKISGNTVFMGEELVSQAVSLCPKKFDIFNTKGQYAFTLSGNDASAIFGVGVTNLYYQHPEDDSVMPFLRKHTRIAARLGNELGSFDLISSPGYPQDVESSISDLYSALDVYTNTEKPMVLLVSDENLFEPVIRLLEHLHGNISEKPFIIPYFNPVTPMVLNKGTVEKMVFSIEKNLPVIFSNYAMYGATSPINPAGSLAILNAELLAGLVFSQLVKEGAPVILGSLPASFDMNSMGSVYTPQSFLLNIACAEMMEFYNLPHCGTSGSGIGWSADLIAAGHLWMNHLTSCLGKVGLVPFVGGNFDSLAFSPNLVVYSDYVIRKSKEFVRGFSLSANDFNLEEIKQTGPGGNFLTSESTLNSVLKGYSSQEIWTNLSYDKWLEMEKPNAMEKLRKHTMELIMNLKAPEHRDELQKKGEAFIKNFKRA